VVDELWIGCEAAEDVLVYGGGVGVVLVAPRGVEESESGLGGLLGLEEFEKLSWRQLERKSRSSHCEPDGRRLGFIL